MILSENSRMPGAYHGEIDKCLSIMTIAEQVVKKIAIVLTLLTKCHFEPGGNRGFSTIWLSTFIIIKVWSFTWMKKLIYSKWLKNNEALQ